MKKLALAALLVSFGTLWAQNKSFDIEINISDALSGGKYVIAIPSEKVTDTLLIKKNGEKIVYSHPFAQACSINIGYIKPDAKSAGDRLDIFISQAQIIKVNSANVDKIAVASLSGGIYNESAIQDAKKISALQYNVLGEYRTISKENNRPKTDSIIAIFNKIGEQKKAADISYIKTNPDKIYSAALLSTMLRDSLPVIESMYNSLSSSVRSSSYGKTIGEKIDVIKAIQVGKPAPDFTLTDIDGATMQLSDYRGKWVLLDFWGSWCIWCRRGNPALVDLYDKYGGKDFEILGLAARDKEEPWKKAIIDDKLTWKHANLGLNEGGDKLPTNYNVAGYPTKILIDPKGNIAVISVGYHEKNDPVELKLIEELGELYVK